MRKILILSALSLFLAAPALANGPYDECKLVAFTNGLDGDIDCPREDDEPNENPIPEPGSALLLAAGLATVGTAIRRRR